MLVKRYKIAGVPLVALETADPAMTLQAIVVELTNGTEPAVLVWDCVQGIRAATEPATQIASALNGGADAAIATGNPVECLRALTQLPDGSVAVLHGMGPILAQGESAIVCQQALWNLRDELKVRGAMVVLTVPLGYVLPATLSNDVITSNVPLPNAEEQRNIIESVLDAAGIDYTGKLVDKAVAAVAGLSAFAIEQAVAINVTPDGFDISGLWETKNAMIEQTRGLSVYRGTDGFDSIGGLEAAKSMLSRLINGKRAPRVVVFIDEIEKAFAGSGTDTSGVSTEFVGTTLSEMEDEGYTGYVFYGQPGAGKTAIAYALSVELGVPCIKFDVGAMKGGLVGESEAAIRSAWQTVRAIGGKGGALVIATCNSMAGLPAELIARFKLGTLFFDLPSPEEQAGIWKIWRKRFDLPAKDKTPDCPEWVGREIATCCDIAGRYSCTLAEASRFIVPVATSDATTIKQRRLDAAGKYLSASTPGPYALPGTQANTGLGRKFNR